MRTEHPMTLVRTLLASVLLACAALLAGCGGGSTAAGSPAAAGGTSSAQACTNCGSAVVSVTDAPGDFLSYIVNVVSLKLTRDDGTVVETVPAKTQVDFAQLVNLSEVLTANQVPAGNYVSATMTIDYAGATIVVDNGLTGVAIATANVIDGTTSLPLAAPNPTQMTLNLTFASGSALVVSPNSVANLALDFNLLASNTIAPSATSPATVTVSPVLTASLAPDSSKQLRVRGALASVDTAGGSYIVDVRPFSQATGSSGQLTVLTTAQTTYEVNGTAATGSAGLTLLAAAAGGTVTVAYGTWDATAQTFTATSVVAGSSVIGNTRDGLSGTVIARTGTTLTVAHGCLQHAGEAGLGYASSVTVTIASTTTVTEPGVTGSFTIQDVSVGQVVAVTGTFGAASSGAPATLDATAGSVALLPTPVTGVVTDISGSTLTLKLQSIGGADAANLSFAGTGASTAQDATATAYTVALPAALPLTGIAAGAPVRLTGYVAPFGTAPPDFNASTLVNFTLSGAFLQVRWAPPGNTAPFATLSATGLTVAASTLTGAAGETLKVGPLRVDPSTLTGGLSIVPAASGSGSMPTAGDAGHPNFAIAHGATQSLSTYATFADFETALSTALTGTNGVLQVLADGAYDASSATLSASQMIVVLAN